MSKFVIVQLLAYKAYRRDYMSRKSIKRCCLFLTLALFLLMISVENRQAFHIAGAVNMTAINNEVMSAKGDLSSGQNVSVKPVFGSSFIQYWYSQNFDRNRWKQELTMLKKLGINEIILQTIADTKAKYAVYPTGLPGYSHNDVDMLENVLSEADLLSMKVRVGVGFNDEWWDKRGTDLEWLKNEVAENKKIIDEVVKMYGKHSSLRGWYIPYEFCQLTAVTPKQQSYLNSFFKETALEMKQRTPKKDIMISPFYYGKLSLDILLPAWSSMIYNILNGTGINIMALQDSVGVGYNSIDKLGDLFFYTKKGTDKAGIRLYSVTETFSTTSSGNVPVSQHEISEQMSKAMPYVEGFAAFSIDHFQNANEPAQLDYYKAYYDYYLSQ